MTCSSASFSSVMTSSSASPAAASFPSPPPRGVPMASGQQQEPRRLPSALNITIAPPEQAAAASPAARRFPTTDTAAAGPLSGSPESAAAKAWPSACRDCSSSSHSAGGAPVAAVTLETMGSAGIAIADSSMAGGNPASIDVLRGEIAALSADGVVGKEEGAVGQEEDAGGRDQVERGRGSREGGKGERGALPAYSVDAALLDTTVRRTELSGSAVARMNRGEPKARSAGKDGEDPDELLGMTRASIAVRSDVFGEVAAEANRGWSGDGVNQDNGNADDMPAEEPSGRGGPTQVLCVPDMRTRDTGECLGIQVIFSKTYLRSQ